jgi:flagellar biogenesis protein FliO
MVSVVARVLGSLALVVGLIFVTALGLRRYLGGAKAPATSRKVSELLEVTPLGGKRYLYLIRVADRVLVVGAGGDQLTLLSEITDLSVIEKVAAAPKRSDFFELLHRMRTGLRKNPIDGEPTPRP